MINLFAAKSIPLCNPVLQTPNILWTSLKAQPDYGFHMPFSWPINKVCDVLNVSLFYREIQQFTENNPYKISGSNAVILYIWGILRAGDSLPSIYYELLDPLASIKSKTIEEWWNYCNSSGRKFLKTNNCYKISM